ncbi:ABC transporter substrate-binding protein [Planotetraspora sp. A-T 1434]|uniref:ABC transporter substrate-binding protein n=1 Tax=Planotetraspora sp. A-T 1434 TaxID=2979219 RepID=UPI0021C0CC88|nr:ABC transporter substrate-binding protein [Planotetraspora sp. A-T 1434]MCT9929664.1 ABC transporter substrate-binding protein [Planotetraspora sp. A-T 1434]
MNRRNFAAGALALAVLPMLAACSGGATTLDTPASAPGSAAAGDSAIVIGTANFSENQILGYLYADVLKGAGLTVTVKPNLGSREIVVPALQNGDIDLLPEYQGSLLLYLDPKATESDSDALQKALTAKLPQGLAVLPPSAAEDADVFTVTKESAAKYGLSTLADLAKHNGKLVFGGPAEDKTRQIGLVGLKEVYGAEFKAFKSLDASGPLVKGALKSGDVDVANLFSTDADIVKNGWVMLTDPKHLIPAQRIVPLIRTGKATETVKTALAKLNTALTTEELSKLDALVDVEHQDPDTVAAEWSKAHGLSG